MLRGLWLFWLGVGSLDGIDRDEWHCEQLAGACDVAGSGGIVEQAVVADAVEPLRQDMHEEAADELVGIERHHLDVSLGTFETVILPFEGDAFVVECDQAAIGDGNAVGVAREVAQHFLGSPERSFAINHPFAVAQRCQIGREGSLICQRGVFAEELQLSRAMDGIKLLQDAPAEQAREPAHGEEDVGSAGDPPAPSSEMPPPGTIMWTCGWWVSAEPQVWRTERTPMRAPRCLRSAAMVIMVSAE